MYLARVAADTPDGTQLRILATADPATGWVDVRSAEQLRLQRRGATADAAQRIAAPRQHDGRAGVRLCLYRRGVGHRS